MSKELEITFRACFAQKMNAIQIGPDNTRLTIDIPASEQLNAIGLQALLQEPLIFTVKRERKFKPESRHAVGVPRTKNEPKGPYSTYWNRMVVKGIKTYPDLQEALDCTPDQVWDALHAQFGVQTMSVVSPDQWEKWVEDNGLNQGLINLSRNAAAEAANTGSRAVS